MLGAPILLTLALAEAVANPIRSHHARIVKGIEQATRQSATFMALIERLNRSDLIIYIESGRCPNPHVLSCVAVTSGSDSYRYLRVTIDTNHSLPVLISQIAHELEHATEIADAPDVVDAPTLRAFYRRVGIRGVDDETYETREAITVAGRVSLELTMKSQHRLIKEDLK